MPEISKSLYRAGEGEPLVLVHGFTATWRCWLPVIAELVPRFEVIVPTLHGHYGGPPLPADPGDTLEDAGDRFEEMLDGLGIGTAHFAGNSLGGAISLEMAKRGRARSVVAISPAGGWNPEDMAEAAEIRRAFIRMQRASKASLPRINFLMRSAQRRRIGFRDVMVRGELVSPSEGAEMVRGAANCELVPHVLESLKTSYVGLTDLDRIKDTPVLITWGDKDRILPMAKHSQRFRDEIAGVEFRVHKGIGHTPMWDDSRLIAATIGDFAAAHAATPAEVAAGT